MVGFAPAKRHIENRLCCWLRYAQHRLLLGIWRGSAGHSGHRSVFVQQNRAQGSARDNEGLNAVFDPGSISILHFSRRLKAQRLLIQSTTGPRFSFVAAGVIETWWREFLKKLYPFTPPDLKTRDLRHSSRLSLDAWSRLLSPNLDQIKT